MSYIDATTYDGYRGRKYFPELDGLRALSVLLVVGIAPCTTARPGTGPFPGRLPRRHPVLRAERLPDHARWPLREEEARGRLSLAAFYVRRCCRILPLYYLTLAAYCLLVFGLEAGANLVKTLSNT